MQENVGVRHPEKSCIPITCLMEGMPFEDLTGEPPKKRPKQDKS
jgi:hypothetical protein